MIRFRSPTASCGARAFETGVEDHVSAVLVVLSILDELADVVEDASGLEQASLVGVSWEESTSCERVIEREGQSRDVLAVGLFVSCGACEGADRGHGVALARGGVWRFEEGDDVALADAAGDDDDGSCPCSFEERLDGDESCEDDVVAILWKSWDCRERGGGLRVSACSDPGEADSFHEVGDLLPCDSGGGEEFVLSSQDDARERREGSAAPAEDDTAISWDDGDGFEGSGDVPSHGFEPACGGAAWAVASAEAFGHADGADGHGAVAQDDAIA